MDIRMVDLRTQYENIKEEIDTAIEKVLTSSAFIKGPFVTRFKERLETYLDCDYVIPCGNGTDALQLALMALDLKPGDEVITTPFTFVATAEMIAYLGLKPVFADVKEDSFNIDPERIEPLIGPQTRCIIPVHLFGQSCDMQEIMAIAHKHDLKVIEDSAQSIGAWYNYNGSRKFCGTMADIGTFSFFPSKNLGCYGDGGAVCTNDKDLAEKINLFANHGSLKKYYYDNIGINSRLDGIQAAILDVKLDYLDEYTRARQRAADRYDEMLKDLDEVVLPVRLPHRNHVFHQYTVKIQSDRDALRKYLNDKGIPTAVYYPAPLYTQSVYRSFKSEKEDYRITESLCNSVLSLPMHTELNEEMQNFISQSVRDGLANA